MATLGQQLREVRLRRGITPDDVSSETCIPASIVLDLEADNYSRFNSVVYVKSFLSSYSKYLEHDISDILKNLSTQDLADPEGIFKRAHTPLEHTEPPKERRERRMPVILAPICIALVAFVAYCLIALFTKRALPFQPSSASHASSASTPHAIAPSAASASGQPASTGEVPRTASEPEAQVSSLLIELPKMAGNPVELLP